MIVELDETLYNHLTSSLKNSQKYIKTLDNVLIVILFIVLIVVFIRILEKDKKKTP